MRREFVECKRRSTAERRCPWAAMVVKVNDGYMAFESHDDYMTWSRQK